MDKDATQVTWRRDHRPLLRTVVLLAIALSSVALAYPRVQHAVSFLEWQVTGASDTIAAHDIRLISVPSSAFIEGIHGALKIEDAELARSIQALAVSRGVHIDDDIDRSIAQLEMFSLTRSANEVWSGLISGDIETPTAFAGTLVSDFSMVGDFRDLYTELSNYPNYDEISVGLSAMNIAATGATLSSGMGALPAKTGLSLIKATKKMGQLTKGLQAELKLALSSSIDIGKLRSATEAAANLDFDQFQSSIESAIRLSSLDGVLAAADQLGKIAADQGYRGTLQTLRLADSTREIEDMARLSEHYGDRYRAVIELTGAVDMSDITVFEISHLLGWQFLLMLASIFLCVKNLHKSMSSGLRDPAL